MTKHQLSGVSLGTNDNVAAIHASVCREHPRLGNDENFVARKGIYPCETGEVAKRRQNSNPLSKPEARQRESLPSLAPESDRRMDVPRQHVAVVCRLRVMPQDEWGAALPFPNLRDF